MTTSNIGVLYNETIMIVCFSLSGSLVPEVCRIMQELALHAKTIDENLHVIVDLGQIDFNRDEAASGAVWAITDGVPGLLQSENVTMSLVGTPQQVEQAVKSCLRAWGTRTQFFATQEQALEHARLSA